MPNMWTEKNNQLCREFVFNDFKEAFAFMCNVAVVVNQFDHHPTWTNSYNKVSILLSTHDAGNTVTEKDRELAAAIDSIFSNFVTKIS